MKFKVQCPNSISRTCLAQEFGLVLTLTWFRLIVCMQQPYKTKLNFGIFTKKRTQCKTKTPSWKHILRHCMLLRLSAEKMYYNSKKAQMISINIQKTLSSLGLIIGCIIFLITSVVQILYHMKRPSEQVCFIPS